MKKMFALFVLSLIVINDSFAKIWRVNNVTGVAADFITAQAANDGAANGDTIHLEPSLNTYGDLTLTKRLYIISTGNFLLQNPGFQQSIVAGFLSNIRIYEGGANGSILSVRFSGVMDIRSQGVSDILLLSCASTVSQNECLGAAAGVLYVENADNIIARNCWFASIDIAATSENIIINNNIIGNRISIRGGSSATITNNVICAVSTGGCQDQGIVNSIVANNIFNKGLVNWGGGFINCLVQNNLSANNTLPTGNGNQNNVDMTTVFRDANGGYIDNIYQLKAGSPAIAAGTNGEDCGAFGGSIPYKLANTPPIPSIYKLTVPASSGGNSMNIIFSTRSNN